MESDIASIVRLVVATLNLLSRTEEHNNFSQVGCRCSRSSLKGLPKARKVFELCELLSIYGSLDPGNASI